MSKARRVTPAELAPVQRAEYERLKELAINERGRESEPNPTQSPVAKAELARLRARASAARERLKHKPGCDELLTSEEQANGAPFYFELRAFIAQLKAAREAAGLTLAQVSEKTTLAEETLCRLESGAVTNPTWRTLGLYAAAVNGNVVLSLTSK